MNSDLPKRHHPAHPSVVSSWDKPIIIFVTICTAGRKPILANQEALTALLAAWHHAADWQIGRFVVMPDHVHFFCTPAHEQAVSLTNWVRFWKSLTTRAWLHPEERPLWQPDHWDRQLRREESYADKWEYVRLNPVRKKLAAGPDDWPYQGELNVLNWR